MEAAGVEELIVGVAVVERPEEEAGVGERESKIEREYKQIW